MCGKSAVIVLAAFFLGVVSTLALGNYFPQGRNPTVSTTYVIANEQTVKEDNGNLIARLLGTRAEDRSSPQDRIKEDQIQVEKDRVVIKIQDAQWSRFTDTKSMDPVLDIEANAIQIVPKDPSEVHLGDIVSYKSDYAEGIIIHRVIEIGIDDKGWYAIMKGDNNPRPDPGKVRWHQIRRVLVAIIY